MLGSLASLPINEATRARRIFLHLIWVVMVSGTLISARTPGIAQVMGEEAEMERLEDRAEEAMANGDPEGATLNSGKAALMASILAERETDKQGKLFYNGVEALFRAQENGYRALALFERAGGQPPAPSSVCQMLDLAAQYGQTATEKLTKSAHPSQISDKNHLQRFTLKTREWVEIIRELRTDFACP